VAAVIGVLAATSLATSLAGVGAAAATARVSAASQSSLSPATEGRTKCVPWPKPTSPGLKCTGTYSGNTAWNPWTWHSISQQPVVTVSQAKDLTDQGIQINWSNFTPTLNGSNFAPNSGGSNTPLYDVSIFECKGTNPDFSTGLQAAGTPCYTPTVGDTGAEVAPGPPNALVEPTADSSSPAKHLSAPSGCTYTGASSGYALSSPLAYQSKTIKNETGFAYCKSPWDGGNPATWTGRADFHVEAPSPKTKPGFFNCASGTPCSLVIVPNFGGTPASESNWTATSRCGQHYIGEGGDPTTDNPHLLGTPGDKGVGDLMGGSIPDYPYAQLGSVLGNNPSVQGASAACWAADRIVIPLSFAPKASNCPTRTPEFYAQGSPMMQTQMLQWQAGWCTGRAPVTLNYTFDSESQAREAFLTSGTQAAGANTDVALTTLPVTAAEQGASRRKFTYAPLANSGAGIAYLVDDNHTGSQINRMVLDPRLLAKLVTESYTLNYGCTSADHTKPSLTCDPAVWGTGNNPLSLYHDPEFLALNKHCQPYGLRANYTCRVGGLNATTAAPTGDWPPSLSVGEPSYETYDGVFLPTVVAQNNDMTYDLTDWIASDPDARAFLNGSTDPWGQRVNTDYLHVSYPTQLFPVQDQGYTQLPECGPPKYNPCLPDWNPPDVTMQAAWNPQPDLNTIADDLLADQPTALQPDASCPINQGTGCTEGTQYNTTYGMNPGYIGQRDLLSELDLGDIAGYQFPAAELVNAAGNAVAPTQASVEAAVGGMKTNTDGITQYVNYPNTSGNEYPLAMVDYAMVPTCGLSHTEASAIAAFLTKAATTGQRQGEAPGELGPGYYPLTAKQKAQTLKAADDVKKQTCTSPPPDHTVSGHHTPGGSGNTPGGSHSHGSGKNPGSQGSPSAGPSPLNHAKTEAFGQKSGDSGLAGLLLLLAIIIGVLLVLGGPAAWVITVTGRWPMVIRGVRAVPARLQAGLGRLAGLVIRRA
jgi:hypothetical protein